MKQARSSKLIKIMAGIRTGLRRPDLVRNRFYGMLNIWPVSRLKNERLCKIPYFCISLKSAAKRRSLVQRQVDGLGLENFRFIDAVVGKDLDIQMLIDEGIYDDDSARKYHGRSLRPTELALSMSHNQVLKTIIEEGLEEAIILEDDVLFMPRDLAALDFSNVPEDCEVLFLHANIKDGIPKGHVRANIFTDESYAASSVAYYVNRDSAAKLLAAAQPIMHASDGLLGRLMRWERSEQHVFRQQGVNTALTCYIIHPPGALNGSAAHFTASSIN